MPIPNDKEKPDLIFETEGKSAEQIMRDRRKYFAEGPVVPLSYYNDPDSGEMVARSLEVMRVLYDAYNSVQSSKR